jgi:hypothetical protein
VLPLYLGAFVGSDELLLREWEVSKIILPVVNTFDFRILYMIG